MWLVITQGASNSCLFPFNLDESSLTKKKSPCIRFLLRHTTCRLERMTPAYQNVNWFLSVIVFRMYVVIRLTKGKTGVFLPTSHLFPATFCLLRLSVNISCCRGNVKAELLITLNQFHTNDTFLTWVQNTRVDSFTQISTKSLLLLKAKYISWMLNSYCIRSSY